MKRRLSIFFVLLANIAILAHAVVPHHHHNKVVAAIVNVLDTDDEHPYGHEHHHDHHQGSHSHHDGDEGCVIFESLQAAVAQLQKSDTGWDKAPHFDGGVTLFFVEPSVWVATPPVVVCASADTSYYASYLTDYLARAKGLRAPPTC